MQSLVEICQVVLEKKIFKFRQYIFTLSLSSPRHILVEYASPVLINKNIKSDYLCTGKKQFSIGDLKLNRNISFISLTWTSQLYLAPNYQQTALTFLTEKKRKVLMVLTSIVQYVSSYSCLCDNMTLTSDLE